MKQRMSTTIVDREIIGGENLQRSEFNNVPLGIYLEQCIRQKFAQHGDKKWLTDVSTGKTMNYSEMLAGIRSIASGLKKRGFQIGDNALVIGSNFIELPLMSFGAWRAGGSQACLFAINLPADVIEMRIREAGSKFILTDYNRAGIIVEVVKKLDFVKEVFVIGDNQVPGCTPFEKLLQDDGNECPESLCDVNLDSMALLTYSSGTTGMAKGVVMTHRNIVPSLLCWMHYPHISEFKYLFVNPMNNTSGLWLTVTTSLAYMDVYCMSNFSEINLLFAIDRNKPWAISLFPCHIVWICRYPHLEKYDLSSVMKITVMGSTVNPLYEREIFNKFPNLLFFENAYGMTEVGIVCQTPSPPPTQWKGLNRLETMTDRVFGSVGNVKVNCKLKVVDMKSGEKLGPNQIGEICLQSLSMLKEYLNNPQETANLIRNGWAHTGDKGFYDENGNIFFVGRIKELIKYRNAHVVPTNVEKHTITHPAIEDVAVVGLPDEDDGERPLAFVVLSHDGKNFTVDDLIAFTNERVMEEEKLRGGIRFIDRIPRNSLGKIIRPELMKQLMV